MKITKIHGKYYDLQDFKHPGGDDAIWHSYGRDATAMFEQYHSMANQKHLQRILQKYEVPENKIMEAKEHLLQGEDDVPQFNFNSEFAQEVKEKVKLHFINKAKDESTTMCKITKASNQRWLLIGFLNLLRILSCMWWLSGSWYGLIAFPLFSWLGLSNVFHDACHFSLSSRWKINRIFSYSGLDFCSPLIWYYQHNISHHSYTNIENKDVDLYHAEWISRESTYSKFKKIYKYNNYLIWIKWCLSYIGTTFNNWRRTMISKKYFKLIPKYGSLFSFREINDKVILFIFLLIRYIFVYNWFKNLLFTFLPTILLSFQFMLNSQITHLHEDTFHHESDWYKHQVLTSSNHSIGSTFGYIFSGGLNYQIEHHLFPGINHCHYPEIQPIVKSICQKHNITYKEFNGYYDAFCSYYNHIKALSKNKEE